MSEIKVLDHGFVRLDDSMADDGLERSSILGHNSRWYVETVHEISQLRSLITEKIEKSMIQFVVLVGGYDNGIDTSVISRTITSSLRQLVLNLAPLVWGFLMIWMLSILKAFGRAVVLFLASNYPDTRLERTKRQQNLIGLILIEDM
jgi:hypothetical protein